jgi:hypothetical protein
VRASRIKADLGECLIEVTKASHGYSVGAIMGYVDPCAAANVGWVNAAGKMEIYPSQGTPWEYTGTACEDETDTASGWVPLSHAPCISSPFPYPGVVDVGVIVAVETDSYTVMTRGSCAEIFPGVEGAYWSGYSATAPVSCGRGTDAACLEWDPPLGNMANEYGNMTLVGTQWDGRFQVANLQPFAELGTGYRAWQSLEFGALNRFLIGTPPMSVIGAERAIFYSPADTPRELWCRWRTAAGDGKQAQITGDTEYWQSEAINYSDQHTWLYRELAGGLIVRLAHRCPSRYPDAPDPAVDEGWPFWIMERWIV